MIRTLMGLGFLGVVTTAAATAAEPGDATGCFANEATLQVVVPETMTDGTFVTDTNDYEINFLLKGGTYCFAENSEGALQAGSVWFMAAHFPGAPKFETVWGVKQFFMALHELGLRFDPVEGYYRPETE